MGGMAKIWGNKHALASRSMKLPAQWTVWTRNEVLKPWWLRILSHVDPSSLPISLALSFDSVETTGLYSPAQPCKVAQGTNFREINGSETPRLNINFAISQL